MNITLLKYEHTFNLGNYESEKFGAECMLTEGEDSVKASASLIEFVMAKGKVVTSGLVAKTSDPAAKETVTEVSDSVKSDEPVQLELPVEEPVVEKPKKEKKAAAPKKEKKVNVPYDRSNELHKKLIGEILDKKHTGWRKDPIKAKEASIAAEGEAFLDDKGQVLESFLVYFAEKMA